MTMSTYVGMSRAVLLDEGLLKFPLSGSEARIEIHLLRVQTPWNRHHFESLGPRTIHLKAKLLHLWQGSAALPVQPQLASQCLVYSCLQADIVSQAVHSSDQSSVR